VSKEAAFKCPAAKLTYCCSFRMYIMLLNLVHKLKCETRLTHIYVIPHLHFTMAMFWGPLLRACL